MLVPVWLLAAIGFLTGAFAGAFFVLVLFTARTRIRTEVANDLVGLLKLVQPDIGPAATTGISEGGIY